MAEIVNTSERHMYQHNATKKIEIRIYVTRENSKFVILFEHTSYIFTKVIVFLRSCGEIGVREKSSIPLSRITLLYHIINLRDKMIRLGLRHSLLAKLTDCNNAVFKKLSPAELRKVIDSTHTTKRMSNYDLDLAEDEYDDYVDYGEFSDGSGYSDEDLPAPPIISGPPRSFPEEVSASAVVEKKEEEEEEEEEPYGYGCVTTSGAHIKHESIPKEVFNKVPVFYICDSCGHCYWDGSHLERILGGRLKHIVTK
ncbi:Exonuclease mut-7 [Homalodisca vitripennis]|nr:Exonuclease mut-7 [Homalodisca vitripennis]